METVKMAGEKGCYRFDIFSAFPVIASFSDRTFNMCFQEDLVPQQHDRKIFCEMLKLPSSDLVCPEQVHSANIVLVTEEMKGWGAVSRGGTISKADGMIVKEKGIPLGVQTADCASIFLYDPRKVAAGIAHVGWRGLYAGMPEKIVVALSNNFLSRPKELYVALGPMIRKCCYEVGEDVASHFQPFISKKENKNHLDLAGAIVAALCASGVKRTHIEDVGLCTSCHHELFYSYRREGEGTGRMLSVIMLG